MVLFLDMSLESLFVCFLSHIHNNRVECKKVLMMHDVCNYLVLKVRYNHWIMINDLVALLSTVAIDC